MIRQYIRNVMAEELGAAKLAGMKEGLSKTAEKVIKKYLDKNLGGAVLNHATKPKVSAAFNELTAAILKEDNEHYFMRHMDREPFHFMRGYFDKLRTRLKNEGTSEANNLLNQFISEKATKQISDYIADPEQLKFIISKINEFQISSTGKV